MKIAIITANIGGFDKVVQPVAQTVPFSYYLYTEPDAAMSCPGWSDRMRSKYPKIQAHKILPGFDIYIWMDARVRVISKQFVANYVNMLRGHDIVTTSHPDRKNVITEFYFMLSEMFAGNKYLLSRYKTEELYAQLEFLMKNRFYSEYPLFSAGISARWNNEKVNAMMDRWWELVLQFGDYDQALYSYALWKHGLKYRTLNFHNSFFKIGHHE